ncbi:hypothetical protein BOW52_10940 [Solemya elarraichensis gill symbiont]|uniref:GIY-YIG domain-containing protein n=1 Tax=Solemya elarraichensis gill symbiont TaxID=1918949 RepID=A0A1T2KTF4_9GAMM|nr:hypothetical protein BOW52_10940 [Solemya elarraichensis gill symbiont]
MSKIFNRHKIKVSYSCMPNIKNNISKHNNQVLKKAEIANSTVMGDKSCNCRQNNQCPLEGKCLQANVIYQATVTSPNQTKDETYIGLAANFKDRFRNHVASFKNIHKRNDTELSKFIWTLKEKNFEYKLKWRILRTCAIYNNTSKRCNLCLHENFLIMCKPHLCSLNKRNELMGACRHNKKFLLCNV